LISNTPLEVLSELAKWMRENGARRARCGDVELELGPMPHPTPGPEEEITDAEAAARIYRQGKNRDAFLFASSEGFPEGFDE